MQTNKTKFKPLLLFFLLLLSSNPSAIFAQGNVDPSFTPIATGYVFTMVVQPDGSILVGGQFTHIGYRPFNRIARLNVDGTLDEDFDPDADNTVHSIALQPDGKILIGGCGDTTSPDWRTIPRHRN